MVQIIQLLYFYLILHWNISFRYLFDYFIDNQCILYDVIYALNSTKKPIKRQLWNWLPKFLQLKLKVVLLRAMEASNLS